MIIISPHSDVGRIAIANFAKQAVERYKDKQFIWEIWNELNISFWKPIPKPDDYFKLIMKSFSLA